MYLEDVSVHEHAFKRDLVSSIFECGKMYKV